MKRSHGANLKLFFPFLLIGLIFSQNVRAEDPHDWAEKNIGELVELYRGFHSHPELSLHEQNTGARVAHIWKALGLEVTYPFGGTGVVGVLRNGKGKTLLLRTDLDALPVTEETKLPYASQVRTKNKDGVEVGVMHACGHDIHITNLIGVAKYLVQNRAGWAGTIIFVAQPAEEIGAGAQAILDAGIYKKFPKPDFALALHVDSELEAGKVGYRPGPTLANADSVDVVFHGRGGHGSMPNKTVDPILMASQFVMELQTLVSRENSPTDPAVVTVGTMNCGTKRNLIPDNCRLQLTVRSYTEPVRKRLLEGIERKAKAVAFSNRADAPTVSEGETRVPAVHNDAALTEKTAAIFRKVLGEKNVVLQEPSLAAEDFGRFVQGNVPVFLFRLGSVDAKRLKSLQPDPPSLHSSKYYPDPEPTLITGITAEASAAMGLLANR